jgi:hypothetical protein
VAPLAATAEMPVRFSAPVVECKIFPCVGR